MSRDTAKKLFQDGKTTWEEANLHKFIDEIYNDMDWNYAVGSGQHILKHEDGRMVIIASRETTVKTTESYGNSNLFFGASGRILTYATPFITPPQVSVSINSGYTVSMYTYRDYKSVDTAGSIMALSAWKDTDLPVDINLIAIGRWK